MEYIACQMTNPIEASHETCVGAIPMLWYPILECASYDTSENQQLTFERISSKITNAIKLFQTKITFLISAPILDSTVWVPTVLYNGKLVDNSITRDAPPLRDVICAYINNDNPECATTA